MDSWNFIDYDSVEFAMIPSQHAALESQRKRLEERKNAEAHAATVCGVDFLVLPGVYDTSVDTELMAETVKLEPDDRFLEIGCGTGAVSLLLAPKCAGGMATDINPRAIENSRLNAGRLKIDNIQFVQGDGFADIQDRFNVLICNPPYNNCAAADEIERMFWDPENHVKELFFREAKNHLLPRGRIYFGWADFGDIDVDLPMKLAAENGLALVRQTERPSRSGKYRFFVMEFAAKK